MLHDPRQGQSSQEFRLALLHDKSGLAGLKEAFGEHQYGDQRKQEDGVRLMAFAVPCWYFVTRRLEDDPPDRCEHHTEEDNGGGIVGDDLIGMTDTCR